MKNPIGLHVQAQAIDRTKFLSHFSKANYGTVTILDDVKLAIQLATDHPDCIVVERTSTFEPAPVGGIAQLENHIAFLKSQSTNWNKVYINLNCEQGFNPDRVAFWTAAVLTASRLGAKLVIGNMASGTVRSGMGSDSNDWLLAESLFKVLEAHPEHLIGIHEYTQFFPWAVSNGQSPVTRASWDKRPSSIDWSLPQWHIGRLYGIVEACDSLGLKVPNVLVTEAILDDMDDIAYLFGDRKAGITNIRTWDGGKARGWRSLSPQWSIWFPGMDQGKLYADMLIWAWETVYMPLGFVKGMHVYCYGDASGRANWSSFTVDSSPSYLTQIEEYGKKISGVIWIEPEEPGSYIDKLQNPLAESDPRWKQGTVSAMIGTGGVNLRLAPTTKNNKPIGFLLESPKRQCMLAQDPEWDDWGQLKFLDGAKEHCWTYWPYLTFVPKEEDECPEPPQIPDNSQVITLLGTLLASATEQVKRLK